MSCFKHPEQTEECPTCVVQSVEHRLGHLTIRQVMTLRISCEYEVTRRLGPGGIESFEKAMAEVYRALLRGDTGMAPRPVRVSILREVIAHEVWKHLNEEERRGIEILTSEGRFQART